MENGTLYLKDVGTHKKYKKTNGRELTLTVPVGTEWKTAVLDADMGYVQAETLSAKTAVLKTEMGSIELGKLKADYAEASGEMGNVEVEEAEIKGLKAEAEMGNIVFAGTVKGPVEADSEMGSITLRLRQEQEEFDYRVSSEMGEVKIDGANTVLQTAGKRQSITARTGRWTWKLPWAVLKFCLNRGKITGKESEG